MLILVLVLISVVYLTCFYAWHSSTTMRDTDIVPISENKNGDIMMLVTTDLFHSQ